MTLRFSDNKAGMDCLDKEKINRVIAESTSKEFGNHEQKRTKRIDQRIEHNQMLLAQITQEQIRIAQGELGPIIAEMEKNRSLRRYKVHIDMDAFFASVECRDEPKLRNIPMAVGGDSMLSTSNYIARKFGVRSAMPGFIARKLCPQLIIVPGSFSKYKRESQIIRSVFERYDPNVSMGSLDEAQLDITEYLGRRTASERCKRVRFTGECVCRLPLLTNSQEMPSDVEQVTESCKKCGKESISVVDYIDFGTDVNQVVEQIRFEVEQKTGLTCSAGIAANGRLAKICSDLKKPNGQYRLENDRDQIVEFMRTLPIRKVPGIGPTSEAVLKAMGISTCGDLFEQRAVIRLLFSKLYSEWLLRVSLGISGADSDQDASYDQDADPKSTSIERTFSPKRDLSELQQIVGNLCEKLINSLAKHGIIGGRSATLKIKFATFDVITRCKSVNFLIRTTETLRPIIDGVLKKELKEKDVAVRLLGVRLSNLKFSEDNSDDRKVGEGGVQQSLLRFVRPSTSSASNTAPVLIELNSDEEMELGDEIVNPAAEEDLLNSSSDEEGNDLLEDTEMAEIGGFTHTENEENSMYHSTQEETEDDDDIVILEEKTSDKPRQSTLKPAKEKPKKDVKKSRKSNASVKGKKPKNVKDLHNYFPIIL